MTLFREDLEFVLERVEPLWESLRGEAVFITGGTGFFGRWLVETLAWANLRLGLDARAVVLTRQSRREPGYRTGDIRTFPFPRGRFRFLIHAALDTADLGTSGDGTRHVAFFARQAGVERWLFTSSGAAYSPHTPLGAAKLDAEQAATGAVIARCFAFIGPYLPLNGPFAAGNFLGDSLNGGPIRVRGDGRSVRSYLHAAELAVHLWRLLLDAAPGSVHDVGSNRAVTIAELAAAFGCAVEFARQPETATVYLPPNGLSPEIGLEEAVARTQRWYRRSGWRR